MASVFLICVRKSFPSPSPFDAPFINPAISTNSMTALILLFDEFNSDNLSNLSSGTSTVATFGSIVQKGKFLASIYCEVNKLNMDDLPTFGIPTKQHLNPIIITI